MWFLLTLSPIDVLMSRPLVCSETVCVDSWDFSVINIHVMFCDHTWETTETWNIVLVWQVVSAADCDSSDSDINLRKNTRV